MRKIILTLAAASAMAFTGALTAQTFTVDLDTYHEIDNTNASGTNWRGYEIVGGASSGTLGNSSTTFSGGRLSLGTFALPSITAAITDADVQFYFQDNDSPSPNAGGVDNGGAIDLYVYNTFSSTELLTGQSVASYNIPYADTSGSPTATGYTLIQKDFVVGDGSEGVTSLSASGKSALTSFLQTNYTSSDAGDYIVFAAALDTNGATDTVGLSMIYNGIAAGSTQQLSITAIPEPSSLALVAGALCLGAVMLRRRRS